MNPHDLKFIADENIPFQVVECLREAGYEVATISEAAHLGMRNGQLPTPKGGWLEMVVSTRELTSLSPETGTTSIGLEERPDASLVWTPSAEPLNAMPERAKPDGRWRREMHPAMEQERGNPRVPVVDVEGTLLMPCTPVKARMLIKEGKARPRWSKLGVFHIQLNYKQRPNNQVLAVGVDGGSKYEAVSVVGTKHTVLNIMSEAVDWVEDAVKQSRQMRRARRYRKTRRRACRGDNRHPKGRVPPSTKARWDAKLRVISQLKEIMPVSHAVIEDIEAETRKGCRRWNASFSPIEVGKQYFYSMLKAMGLEVVPKSGKETKEFRDRLGLKKVKDKSKHVFESHCVDSWCLGAMATGITKPIRSLYYMVPLRFHRRQLHRLEPSKGGVRSRYGGTLSLGLKRGTLIKHVRHGLCYVGGNLRNRFSLHNLKTGKRITQDAKREEFKVLTRISFRTQFLPRLKTVGFLSAR